MAGVTRVFVTTAAVGLVAATVPAAASVPGDPRIVPRPADIAYARTILLRPRELPGRGWKGTPRDFGNPNPRCVLAHFNMSSLTATARVGTTFERPAALRGVYLADADAFVFVNRAQAAKAFGIYASPAFGRCIASVMLARLPKGAVGTSRVTSFSIQAAPARSGAFEIEFRISASGSFETIVEDVVSLRRGRAVATLSVLGLESVWSRGELRAAASRMASRMTKG